MIGSMDRNVEVMSVRNCYIQTTRSGRRTMLVSDFLRSGFGSGILKWLARTQQQIWGDRSPKSMIFSKHKKPTSEKQNVTLMRTLIVCTDSTTTSLP